MNNVCFDKLKYAVRQVLGLLPDGRGHKHLAVGVPVNAYVLDLLQFNDCAWAPIQKRRVSESDHIQQLEIANLKVVKFEFRIFGKYRDKWRDKGSWKNKANS